MPSTATIRNRFEMQGAGENSNTWGAPKLNNALAQIDWALDGVVAFTLSGAKTLTSGNFKAGAENEAAARVLDITGGTGGTITIPAIEKLYLVRNGSSGDVVITTGGGQNATLKAGLASLVFSDGGNVFVDSSTDDAFDYSQQAAASAAAADISASNAADSEDAAEAAAIQAGQSAEAAKTWDPTNYAAKVGGNTFSGPQRVTATTLTDAATVTPDLSQNNMFVLTMGGNRTIANPTGMANAVGQEVLIIFRGAFQPSFGSYYKFPYGMVPTFSGSLNAIGGTVISATEILMHGGSGYA